MDDDCSDPQGSFRFGVSDGAGPSPTGRQASSLCRGRAQRGSLVLPKRTSLCSEGQGLDDGDDIDVADHGGDAQQPAGGGRGGSGSGDIRVSNRSSRKGGASQKSANFGDGGYTVVAAAATSNAGKEQRDTIDSSEGNMPATIGLPVHGGARTSSDMRAKRSRAPAPLETAFLQSESETHLDDGDFVIDSDAPVTPTWEGPGPLSWTSSPVHSLEGGGGHNHHNHQDLESSSGGYGMHGYYTQHYNQDGNWTGVGDIYGDPVGTSNTYPGRRYLKRHSQQQRLQQQSRQPCAEQSTSPVSAGDLSEGLSYNIGGRFDGMLLGVPSYTFHVHAFELLGQATTAAEHQGLDLLLQLHCPQTQMKPGQKRCTPVAPPMIRPVSTTLNRRRKALQERLLTRHMGSSERKSGTSGRTNSTGIAGLGGKDCTPTSQSNSLPPHGPSRSWDPLGSAGGPGGTTTTITTANTASVPGLCAGNGTTSPPVPVALNPYPSPKLPTSVFPAAPTIVSRAPPNARGGGGGRTAGAAVGDKDEAGMVVLGSTTAGSMLVAGTASGNSSGSPIANSKSIDSPCRASRGSVTFALTDTVAAGASTNTTTASAAATAATRAAVVSTQTSGAPPPQVSTSAPTSASVGGTATTAAIAMTRVHCETMARAPSPPSSPRASLKSRRPASARDRAAAATAAAAAATATTAAVATPSSRSRGGIGSGSSGWNGNGWNVNGNHLNGATTPNAAAALLAGGPGPGPGPGGGRGPTANRPRSAGVSGRIATFPPWTTKPESRAYRFDR